jgi:hypothetical protein
LGKADAPTHCNTMNRGEHPDQKQHAIAHTSLRYREVIKYIE